MHERRLLFILILLALLLRVDDYSMRSVIFFSAVLIVISFDFIATYLPRKMAFLTVTMVVGVIVWNIMFTIYWSFLHEKKTLDRCVWRRNK